MIIMNKTLLEALFISPNPQPERDEVKEFYQLLDLRMYPNKRLFIDFLSSQNIDKQYECSVKIIQSLCYFANFPPTIYSIMDVQYIENDKKYGSSPQKHVSRDHFIHLVNLYLLGIYVFFYDKQFYDKILIENRYERKYNVYGNEKVNRIKDFISEWKYFCLYHDIGYGAEALSEKKPQEKIEDTLCRLNSIKGGFKYSLSSNNIMHQIIFLSTIEIMAKVLLCQFIINYSQKNNRKDFKLGQFKEKQLICYSSGKEKYDFSQDVFLHRLENCFRLEKIYSNHCLKPLIPILGDENIIIIGSDASTGEISFVSLYNNNDKLRELVFEKKSLHLQSLQNIIKSPELLLFDDYSADHYDIDYILLNDNKFDDVKKELGIGYLDGITDITNGLFVSQFEAICNESQFMDFQFDLYMWLNVEIENKVPCCGALDTILKKSPEYYDFSDDNRHGFDIQIEEEIIHEGIENLEIQIDEIFIEYIKDSVQNRRLTKKQKNNYRRFDEKFRKQANWYINLLKDLIDSNDFEKQLSNKIRRGVLDKLDNECNLLRFYAKIYERVYHTFLHSNIKFDYNYENIKWHKDLKYLSQIISNKTKESLYETSVKKIIDSYRHGFSFIDHGICSACYAEEIFRLYQTSINKIDNTADYICISILLDFFGSHQNMKQKYITNYSHVICEVVYAVFMHNIYPSWFSDRSDFGNYKTSINSPFTFFAILCDSLQQWNRPHMISASLLGRYPNRDATDRYNITIENGIIYIYDGESEQSHEKLCNDIKGLRDYLDNPDAFVKIKY